MARTKRIVGASGVYHILLRGRDGLFLDDADYHAFLQTMREYFDGAKSCLLGYALLPGRAHLIGDFGREPLSAVMKPFCTSYARYYNRTHQKTGKLFYDRYKSVPLENGEDLADELAFIHAAPDRAGLEDWPYSSRKEYEKGAVLCDTVRAEKIAGGWRQLMHGDSKRLGLEDYVHMSDGEIENYMRALCGYGFLEFRALAEPEKKAALGIMRRQKWVKLPRLAELLDWNFLPPKKEPAEETQKEELSVWLL